MASRLRWFLLGFCLVSMLGIFYAVWWSWTLASPYPQLRVGQVVFLVLALLLLWVVLMVACGVWQLQDHEVAP